MVTANKIKVLVAVYFWTLKFTLVYIQILTEIDFQKMNMKLI